MLNNSLGNNYLIDNNLINNNLIDNNLIDNNLIDNNLINNNLIKLYFTLITLFSTYLRNPYAIIVTKPKNYQFIQIFLVKIKLDLQDGVTMSGYQLLEIGLLNNQLVNTFAENQLIDTKFINCSNPVNPGLTGFEQLTKKVTTGQPVV